MGAHAPLEGETTRPGLASSLLRALLFAVSGLLFLAGMLDDLWVAAVLAGVFVVVRLAKSGVIPFPPARWRKVMERIPVLVRFGAALLVINGIAKAVIGSSLGGTASFQFMVWPVAAGVVLLAILVPESPAEPAPELRSGAR